MFLDKLGRNIQFRFKDRTSGACALGDLLKDSIKKVERKDTVILAIPRAGVLTADIIAQKLSISTLEPFFIRKLTDPDNKEQAIGAIVDNGFTLVLQDLVKRFQITPDYIEKEKLLQLKKINQSKRKYCQNPQNNSLYEKIKDHRIILVIDDGIATGATIMVTAKWLSQFSKDSSISRKRVIIAAPVAPKQIADKIRRECLAEVITVFHPNQTDFHSVEQYHKNFEQVTEEEVINILKKRTLSRNLEIG